jgi:hypothetical protein
VNKAFAGHNHDTRYVLKGEISGLINSNRPFARYDSDGTVGFFKGGAVAPASITGLSARYIAYSDDGDANWYKLRAGYADDAGSVKSTKVGLTGNQPHIRPTTAQEWSDLPVGIHTFVHSGSSGIPVDNYGYFIKASNRDVSGGWGGIWAGYRAGQNYIGRAATSTSFASWDKLWSDANHGSGSGLDADLLDGKHASDFLSQTGYYYANHKITVPSSANYKFVILLCETGGVSGIYNHCVGRFYGRQVSGNTNCMVVDVMVNNSSSGSPSGHINVMANQINASNYKLVTCAYDGKNYIGLHITATQYTQFGHGMWFTGQCRTQSNTLVMLAEASVTNIVDMSPTHSQSYSIGANTTFKGDIVIPNLGYLSFRDVAGNEILNVRGDIGDTNEKSIQLPGLARYTTSSSANVHASSYQNITKVVSARKYKTDIEPITLEYAENFFNNCVPSWYRSLCTIDKPEWSWYGYIADDVAEFEPRLVQFDENGEPNGFNYDRVASLLHVIIKDNRKRIKELENTIEKLENKLFSLEKRLSLLEAGGVK